jgi:hypothetical protein
MVKNLYKGVFSFPHKAYVIRRSAYSTDQAKILMARAIAQKQGADNITVLKWLKDNPTTYVIKLEIEWQEDDDSNGQED